MHIMWSNLAKLGLKPEGKNQNMIRVNHINHRFWGKKYQTCGCDIIKCVHTGFPHRLCLAWARRSVTKLHRKMVTIRNGGVTSSNVFTLAFNIDCVRLGLGVP